MEIDHERPEDVAAIRALTDAAFKGVPYSNETESRIVDALRDAGALTLSITARSDGEIVGHAAFSPVLINGERGRWYGLGPVSVAPERQRQGFGSAAIRSGLEQLQEAMAEGCVVFGSPLYYGRFGFVSDPRLFYAGAPEGYFQRLMFASSVPVGEVTYHPGFDA